ncbi:MAG: hypothetical protein Kow0029_32130 [Candidatus Rifleibacteriota bacterium]
MPFNRHLLLTFFLLVSVVQSNFSITAAPLLPLKNKATQLYGYVTPGGKVAIEAQFDDASRFSQGFAAVSKDGSNFYIDENAINQFARDFNETRSFSEGLAAVRLENKWGYINLKGEMVIKPDFLEAYEFSEGLACVMTGSREENTAKYGYIDKTGNFVIKPFLEYYDNQYFSHPGKFSQGMAYGWLPADNGSEKIGFFDKNGKVIIQPAYFEAGDFADGLAPVAIAAEMQESVGGFIDLKGNMVISPLYNRVFKFSGGLAPASTIDQKSNTELWGYIDTQGNWKIPAQFYFAEPFYEGFAKVYTETFDDEAYIDSNGKLILTNDVFSSKTQLKIIPTSITTSSSLPPSKSADYLPENLFDNNLATAWIEGNANNGMGEWVEFKFSEKKKIGTIFVANGYQKISRSGKDLYYSNLRPSKLRIYVNGKRLKDVLLKDSKEPQKIEISEPASLIKLEILDVYTKGAKDQDCGFSEIWFSER